MGQALVSNKPFELVRCNLCGGDDTQLIATRSRLDIPLNTVICKRCGLIYHNPRMTLEGFVAFYQRDYRRLIGAEQTPGELFAEQVKHARVVLEFVGDTISRGARVLDIGSGPGGQLWFLRKELGCDVIGIEPAIEHAEWARREHGLNIIAGIMEDVELEPASFDFVIITQTLNHLLDPLKTMRWVYSLLRPNGKFFVEVLDFVYFTRLAPLTLATTIDHPYMFYPDTLRAMLQTAGFDIVKQEADADFHSRQKRDGRPNMHVRVLANKSVPPTALAYPSYRAALREIRRNQFWYRVNSFTRSVWTLFDRAKGLIRRVVGERVWRALAKTYHQLRGAA
jgi:2-polyprenyl-3-methyl-5-hydroxy-6-metoxy-1,4-benzoquinol methylase